MSKKPILMSILVCLMVLSFLSPAPARAQAGISDLNPAMGTVGSQITISGAGFGAKHGEVLIGKEKCKVLEWSDSEITCQIYKPQPWGFYPITVHPQGDKKPANPLTIQGFAMRRPQINQMASPAGLEWDGKVATIHGEFFGDKKGDVYLASIEDGMLVDHAKVRAWSMDSVQFELPRVPAGRFILVVSNDVGAGGQVIDIAQDGSPALGNPPGIGGEHTRANASGIYYNGVFYVFTVHEYLMFYPKQSYRIQVRTFKNGVLSTDFLPIAEGYSHASVVPLVIEGKLWVFATGTDGTLRYTTFNGTVWDSEWYRIGSTTEQKTNDVYEIAPVYIPETRDILVYYEHGGSVYLVVKHIDVGGWGTSGPCSGFADIKSGPSAVAYKGSVQGHATSTLVAATTKDNEGVVYGAAYCQAWPWVNIGTSYERPYLSDLGSDKIALLYHIQKYTENDLSYPQVLYMDKATATWSEPSQPVASNTEWGPNGAINYEMNSSGVKERVLYMFWGYTYYFWCIPVALPHMLGGSCQQEPVWWMTPIANLGP